MFKTLQTDISGSTNILKMFTNTFAVFGKSLSSWGNSIKNVFSIFNNKDSFWNFITTPSKSMNVFAKMNTAFSTIEQPIAGAAGLINEYNNAVDNGTLVSSGFYSQIQNGNNSLTRYLGTLNGAKASTDGYTSSLKVVTLAEKAAGAAAKAMGFALKTALNVGVGILINLAVTKIFELINAQKEAREAAVKLAQGFENTKKSLEDLRTEYIDIVDSTNNEAEKDEKLIDWKKKLIEQYGLEKEALDGVNGSREAGLKIIDDEIYNEAEKTIAKLGDDYAKSFDKIYNTKWEARVDISAPQNAFKSFKKELNSFGIEYSEIFNSLSFKGENTIEVRDNLEKALALLRSYQTAYDAAPKDSPIKIDGTNPYSILKALQKEYDEISKVVDENEANVTSGLAAYAQKYIYEYTQTTGNAVKDVTENSFADWKSGLVALAGDSKPLQDNLAKLADDTFPDFAAAMKASADGSIPAVTKVNFLTSAINALKEALDGVSSSADKYLSAIEKVVTGKSLSRDEILDLIGNDSSLFDKFVKTDDGWTIDAKTLADSYNQYVDGINLDILDDANEQLRAAQENLTALEVERSNLKPNDSVTRAAASDLDKKIAEQKQEIENAKNNIDVANLGSELFPNITNADIISKAFDSIVSKIDEYNKSISTVTNTIDTLNEGNSLSYDEMTALVTLYPELKNSIVQTADGYTFETSTLETLKKQSYDTRNSYIDNQIAMTDVAIEEQKARLELLLTEISMINSADEMYAANKKGGLIDQVAAIRAEIEKLSGDKSILDSFRNEILSPSSSSSSSTTDVLQQEIDMYQTLISAIQTVADKRVKALEDVKSGLEKQKEALQDKNDEEQRALDLAEAQNKLDKAKKQKVWVYQKDKGLVQVNNTKAVSDAQSDVNKIQSEIEQDKIQAQIDAVQSEIDNVNNYKDSIGNISSDVSDLLAVEQAKAYFGTDENGLLSLPADTLKTLIDNYATATLKKDKEDNADNSFYKSVSLDDFLKALGSDKTAKDLAAFGNVGISSSFNSKNMTTPSSATSTSYLTTNKAITVNAPITINGATDPISVANAVKVEMNNVFKGFINWVK